MGTEEEARDLCQETFLRAYRALGGFKGEARFSSWLYQIALNLCRDRMRRNKGRTLVSLDELEEAGNGLLQKGPTPLELVEAGDMSRAVASAVAALPAEQREVIVLKEYQDLTFVEIAEILGAPLGRVRHRLVDARSRKTDRAAISHRVSPNQLNSHSWRRLPCVLVHDVSFDNRPARVFPGDLVGGAWLPGSFCLRVCIGYAQDQSQGSEGWSEYSHTVLSRLT
jgi:RNA polymerase sigma-70 factor (ECF subfamily)